MAAEHRNRQIAKTNVLGKHGQQRFDDARTKAVADDHTVDVTGIERTRRALDAERPDKADPLADRDRKLRIAPATAGDQNRCLLERIAGRQFRQRLAVGSERFQAAQDRTVQRADARCRAKPAGNSFRRHACSNRQRMRHRSRAVLVHAGDDRRERAVACIQPSAQRAGILSRTFAIGAGFGQHHRFRFDRSDGGNGVRPIGFDDRESARCAQGLDDIRRRAVCNNNERTLQRHGQMRTFFSAPLQPCQSAVNTASTDAVHFGFVIRDAAGRREPAGNVVPSVADHNKVTAE